MKSGEKEMKIPRVNAKVGYAPDLPPSQSPYGLSAYVAHSGPRADWGWVSLGGRYDITYNIPHIPTERDIAIFWTGQRYPRSGLGPRASGPSLPPIGTPRLSEFLYPVDETLGPGQYRSRAASLPLAF